MGCLEQGTPSSPVWEVRGFFALLGAGVSQTGVSRGWGELVGIRGTCPVLLCFVLLGRILGGDHLRPDGTHLLGGLLQRAAVINNPGCDRLTLLVGSLRGDTGARILLTHAA